VIGYRTGPTSWHDAGGTSAEHFDNCSGVAFAVAAKVDIKVYATLDVSVYVDLACLTHLNSKVSLVDQGWTKVDRTQLQAWGLGIGLEGAPGHDIRPEYEASELAHF
jgi:hypothetical protein